MLNKIDILPTDKRIAGVHCVPLLDDGSIVMAWDKDEQVLTTIGGRIEGNESIDEALNREVIEEAGIILKTIKTPFASWYWKETGYYPQFYIASSWKFLLRITFGSVTVCSATSIHHSMGAFLFAMRRFRKRSKCRFSGELPYPRPNHMISLDVVKTQTDPNPNGDQDIWLVNNLP